MRFAMAILAAACLVSTGCESSKRGEGMSSSIRVDGNADQLGVINIGPLVPPPLSVLDFTVTTDNFSLIFEMPSGGGAEPNKVMLGPFSSATIHSTGFVSLNMGWMFWRGPRLVGRTRRFAPGPPVSPMVDSIYRYILQVDPHATNQRHFIYYAADTAFMAVDGTGVELDTKGEFAEVGSAATPTMKSLGDLVSDSQKQFFNYANKTAQDANYPYFVTPFP